MISPVSLDTLKFVEELKKDGFTQQQAETQAKAQSKVVKFLFEKLATKKDLLMTKKDIHQEIKDVHREIKDVRKDLHQEIKDVHREIKDVRAAIQNMADRVTIRLGSIVGVAVAVLVAVIKLF